MTVSLGARFGVTAAVVVGVIVLGAGLVLVHVYAAGQRDGLDAELRRQACALALGVEVTGGGPGAGSVVEDLDVELARIRVVHGGEPTIDIGPGAHTAPSELTALDRGFATVTIAGEPWRFAAEPAERADAVVQLGRPLVPFHEAVADLRRTMLAVGGGAIAVALSLGWWLGGRLTAPLSRLRDAAGAITSARELHRRVPANGPSEVRSLAGSINTMLDRLDASTAETNAALDASRSFTAAVAHELRTPLTSIQANLDFLYADGASSDGIPPDIGDRGAALVEIADEQRRLIGLLDGLHLLSMGDTPTALPWREVDLTELTDARVQVARRRHPGDIIEYVAPDEPVILRGWEQGVAALVDNLVINALTHGRQGNRPVTVRVTLESVGNHRYRLTVDDDGPGIPTADRDAVFASFTRGRSTAPGGSGLGLALVAQQAAIHGGAAHATQSPMGGARLVIDIPTSPDPTA